MKANFWFVFQTKPEFIFVLDSPTLDQIFSNLGSRHHLSEPPNDCEGRSGAWEGRLCVDYRPRPQERAALDFDICQTKPGPWDFYHFMLGSYNCVKTRSSTSPPQKKMVTGIDRGQYGLLASGPGALAGLLPTNRVTQPPNFLSKVVFAGGVKVKGTLFDTSFFIVLYHSRHVVTQFDNLN